MTTLVFRDGVLAADSRCTNNDWIASGAIRKVRRLADGTLLGFCGTLPDVSRLAEALEAGKDDLPEIDGKVVVIRPSGAIRVYEDKGWFDLDPAPFHAWGSGMPPALGALHMGASAEQAVRIACLVDSGSGGPVRSVRLGKPKPEPEPLRFNRYHHRRPVRVVRLGE